LKPLPLEGFSFTKTSFVRDPPISREPCERGAAPSGVMSVIELTQLVTVGFTRRHDFLHTHPDLPRGFGHSRHDDARQRDGVLPNVSLIT
jgi:hypothetical protein